MKKFLILTQKKQGKIDKISPKKAKKLGAKLDIKKIANKKMTVAINGKWTSKKNALITKGVLTTKQNIKMLNRQLSTLKKGFSINLSQKLLKR